MNVFDMIGPIMIGPSSSHTAGAARIGLFANNLLSVPAIKADILFHGSFAKTYLGHGTDKAIVAGIMGFGADDERIKNSLFLAKEAGLEVIIRTGSIPRSHPNTAQVTLTDGAGKQISVVGESVGGGTIRITSVNGLSVDVSGQYETFIIVHQDTPGAIAGVTNYMSGRGVNVANIHLSRKEKGGTAIMTIEIDGQAPADLNEYIEGLPSIDSSSRIPKL